MTFSKDKVYVLSQEQKDLGIDDNHTYTLNETTESGAYFNWTIDVQ